MPDTSITILNEHIKELYEELNADGVVAPAKVARHFQDILEHHFNDFQFPENMDEIKFTQLQAKIDEWMPEIDSRDIIKDSLKAVLTKKYIDSFDYFEARHDLITRKKG